MCALGNSKGRSPLGLSGAAARTHPRTLHLRVTISLSLLPLSPSHLLHASARSRASLLAPISRSSQLCSVVVVFSASTPTVKVHSRDHSSRVTLHNAIVCCTRVARSLAGNCIRRTNSAIRRFSRIDLVYLTSCFNVPIFARARSLSLYNLSKVFPKYSC